MINDNLLEKNGYTKYNDNVYNSETLYQKKVKDKKGTKYFVDFYKYVFTVFNNEPIYEVRLHINKDNYSLNILLYTISKDMSLEEIEKEVDKIWHDLGGDYYEYE